LDNRGKKAFFVSRYYGIAIDKKDWSGDSKGREAPLGLRSNWFDIDRIAPMTEKENSLNHVIVCINIITFHFLPYRFAKQGARHPLVIPRPVLSFRGQRKTGQRRALFHTCFTYRLNALSKLAYQMQGSILLVTYNFAGVTVPKATTLRQLKSLKGKTKSSLKTFGAVRNCKDVFDSL
jgi:hypothetical protein